MLRYLSHPQVAIDPAVPAPSWGLSDTGRSRAALFASWRGLAGTGRIVASEEVKARETAAIIGNALGLHPEACADLDENDRSATGYLDPEAFDVVVGRFFAEPESSARGWERAVDAQARVVAAADAVIARHKTGDLLIVGHGAVGTLLYCHHAGLPIERRHFQPQGGGNVFTIDFPGGKVLSGWQPIEEVILI